jgi:hypothetical protein
MTVNGKCIDAIYDNASQNCKLLCESPYEIGLGMLFYLRFRRKSPRYLDLKEASIETEGKRGEVVILDAFSLLLDRQTNGIIHLTSDALKFEIVFDFLNFILSKEQRVIGTIRYQTKILYMLTYSQDWPKHLGNLSINPTKTQEF